MHPTASDLRTNMPFVSSTELRQRFSLAMSEMYRKVISAFCSPLPARANLATARTCVDVPPSARRFAGGPPLWRPSGSSEWAIVFSAGVIALELTGDLLYQVRDVNEPLLDTLRPLEASRLKQERHGAIRVGKEEELRNLARLFKQLGMHAVGEFQRTAAPKAEEASEDSKRSDR